MASFYGGFPQLKLSELVELIPGDP